MASVTAGPVTRDALGVLVKAGRIRGFGQRCSVRSAARASGQTGEIRTTRDTHTANLSLRRRDRPQSLRTKRARPGRDGQRRRRTAAAPLRATRSPSKAVPSTPVRQPATAHAAGRRLAGVRRAAAARFPHALGLAGSGSARSSLRRKRTVQGSRVAGGVVCTVGRRARWRAPRKGTQNKSLDAAVA